MLLTNIIKYTKNKIVQRVKKLKIVQNFENEHGRIYKSYKYTDMFLERLVKHHVFMIAAGIAYNIIVYMIPLFLIAIYVISLAFGTEGLAETIADVLKDFLPPTEATDKLLKKVVDEVHLIMDHSSLFGVISIFVLLWISSFLVSSIRYGLNTIFELKDNKIFLFYRMKDMIYTVILAVLVLIYSYAVPSVTFAVSLLQEFLPDQLNYLLTRFALSGITLITATILFYFIFKFLPNEKLPRRTRVLSTILCVLLIESGRHVFGWYVSSISSYGKFYGTYAVIVSLAIWIYYSALIILFSAEFSRFFFDIRKLRRLEKIPEPEFD